MSRSQAASSPAPRREIGSYFESIDPKLLLEHSCDVPWEHNAREYLYLETGRQALRLIVLELLKCGVNDVLLPEYLCDSVLDPFLSGPINLAFFPVNENLQLDLRGLEAAVRLRGGSRCAVVMSRYFGCARDEKYVSQIGYLQSLGHVVVEDLTHSLFDRTPSSADYTFASLRKLLPVATGAFVSGLQQAYPRFQSRKEVPTSLWKHMDAKREFVAGEASTRGFYQGLLIASSALESATGTHGMDDRSVSLLKYLPYDRFIQSRRDNFEVLHTQLSSLEEVTVMNGPSLEEVTAMNGSRSSVASHLVMRSTDSDRSRRKLSERGIYCAVHWPRPTALPCKIRWTSNHFSVPIDHRYSITDMMHVGSSIKEILS